jgi:hypothetical protein
MKKPYVFKATNTACAHPVYVMFDRQWVESWHTYNARYAFTTRNYSVSLCFQPSHTSLQRGYLPLMSPTTSVWVDCITFTPLTWWQKYTNITMRQSSSLADAKTVVFWNVTSCSLVKNLDRLIYGYDSALYVTPQKTIIFAVSTTTKFLVYLNNCINTSRK